MSERSAAGAANMLERIYATIESRRSADPETSHTARLFQAGRAKMCQKLGEEAVETVVAALAEPRERLVSESADLLYHLLVVWAEAGVKPQEVWDELGRRQR